MKAYFHTHQWILATVFTVLAILMAPSTEAQIRAQLKMNKRTYLLNEPVKATLEITNQTGGQLNLHGRPGKPWMMFHVTVDGQALPQARRIEYKPAVIPMGQTIRREVVLNSAYALGYLGNYVCEVAINLPGTVGNAISSNRDHFVVSTGRTTWSERAGVPGSKGETREFRIVSFSGNGALELFAEVHSVNRNSHMATVPLGQVMNFRNPKGVLDRANTMHLLYQVKPEYFVHVNISLDGKVISAQYIKRAANSLPKVTKLGNGTVMVTGGTLYNPEEEAAKRKKIHNASDRPATIFR